MDCVLCASSGHPPPGSTSSPSPELTNNCLNDLGSFTGQRFAHSLCQLLDLPPHEFQDKFLQPDISFCSSCTQSLSTIWILLDQLEQLQKQISEVKGHVTSRIFEALQNNDEDNGSNSGSPTPAYVLRSEISRVIVHRRNSTDNFTNPDIREQEQIFQTFGFGGIIEDTTVKEETGVEEEIQISTEPESHWCPFDNDYDDANVVDGTEVVVKTTSSDLSTLLPIKSKRTRKKTSKALEAMKQEVYESKRVLRVSLTRLEAEDNDVNKIKGQGQKSTNVKLKTQPCDRKTKTKKLNLKQSMPNLFKSLSQINEREKYFKAKYGKLSNTDSQAKSSRKTGRRISRPQVEKTISCTFTDCPEKFRTIMSRHHHNRRVHSVASFQCPHCPRTFKSQIKLDPHVRIHTGEKPYVCDVCGNAFRSDFYLKNHQTRHTPEDRRFPCPHCPFKCLTMNILRVHLTIHTGEKPFMCELCSLSFRRKVELMNHQTNIHANELNLKPFKCKFCGKILHSASYLNIHEKTHTEVGKHSCHLCSFSCDRPSRLKHHLKTHSDERQHSCPYCDKTYKYDHQIKIHIRGHTGERPHKCKECPKDFKDREHLKRHVAVAHSGLTPFKCPSCGDAFPVRKYLNRHTEKHRLGKIPIPLQPIIEDGPGQGECGGQEGYNGNPNVAVQEESAQVQTHDCEFQDLIGTF